MELSTWSKTLLSAILQAIHICTGCFHGLDLDACVCMGDIQGPVYSG